MVRETVQALAACIVTIVLCSFAYPVAVWVVGQLLFPTQAEGSLIRDHDGNVIGSALIAQPFTSEKYFFPRPSAVDYKADATGGSNLGTKNPDLRKKVTERAEAYKATEKHPVPADLVTASGGGMDPHISPEGARYQVSRVASARGVPVKKVSALIEQHTERSGAIIGAPARVNVLELNLALDEEMPAPATPPPAESTKAASTDKPADSAKAEEPGPSGSDDAAAARARITALSEQIGSLRKQVEALDAIKAKDEFAKLGKRLDQIADQSAALHPLVEKVDHLDGRLVTADMTLQSLRTTLGEVKNAFHELQKSSTSKPELSPPVSVLSSADLSPGFDLFRKAQYAEAADAFRALTKSHPEDARAWYLAAAANGTATKQWTGDTENLVQKGVEREKAGTPDTAAIDAALADLTTFTGRDWVAYFRKQIVKK